MHRCGEYAGDNMMIRGSSTDAFFEFISYKRTPQNYRLQSFWDSSYKAIAQSSNVIKLFKEGESVDIDNKLGECYFIRGLMYFYLVRAYGRPYYQQPEKSLGVPIVNGTPEDVGSGLSLPDRATVEDTYKQVIADLEKAEKLLTKSNGPAYASKEAAQALLSRIYLYMSGTYEAPNRTYAQKAVDYASLVINSGKYTLLGRDEFMKYPTFAPESNKESIFVVRRRASEYSGYDHYYGVGGMYANIGGMGWGEMFASAKFLALLDETGRNDWRPEKKKIVDARAAFVEPNYGTRAVKVIRDGKEVEEQQRYEVFRFIKDDSESIQNYAQFTVKTKDPLTSEVIVVESITTKGPDGKSLTTEVEHTIKPLDTNSETYQINYKGKVYKGVLDYFIKLNRVYPEFYIVKCSRETENSHLHSPVISRLGEVYLNRAEALAKLGKYEEARRDLNLIRERSLPGRGYSSLSASDAGELIDKERQLELAYQAERSYDVYRNGKSLTRRYPGPHNQVEEVKATDYRVVYYIPQNAINAYPGTLTQNPTSN